MSTNEDPRRAARRAAMPIVSALVEEWRAMFPTKFEVIFAQENGIKVGRLPDYSDAFTVPANYWPMRAVEPITKGKK